MVRSITLEAVLKDYTILLNGMKEINFTMYDDDGLMAYGKLVALEKFDTLLASGCILAILFSML